MNYLSLRDIEAFLEPHQDRYDIEAMVTTCNALIDRGSFLSTFDLETIARNHLRSPT